MDLALRQVLGSEGFDPMDLLIILGQLAALGILAWGVYRYVAKRDRGLAADGRRHTDTMAANEARSLFVSQRKELAELASKYCRE